MQVIDNGPGSNPQKAGSGSLLQLIEAVRRPTLGSQNDTSNSRIDLGRNSQARIDSLVAKLETLGQTAKTPFRSTGLVSAAEIHQAAETASSDADAIDRAEFFRGLTVEQQIRASANPFAVNPGQSVTSEIFSKETAAIYSLETLLPAQPAESHFDTPPTNITQGADQAMKPDAKYFLWVVLEEIAGHTPTLDGFEWSGSETLEEIEEAEGYEVLVAPPGTNDSLTVAEWFEIHSRDGQPARHRHLKITRITKDNRDSYTAVELVGELTIQEVVANSVRMKAAANKATAYAEDTLKKLIQDARPDTLLADVVANLTNSGQTADPKQAASGTNLALADQPIQTAVTAPFSWTTGATPTAASTGIPDPTQQGISEIPELPVPHGGQGAGQKFMETFCETIGPGEIGVALSYDHKAVYIGRLVSRDSVEPSRFGTEIDTLLSNSSLRMHRRIETNRFLHAWLADFRLQHGWDGIVLGFRR